MIDTLVKIYYKIFGKAKTVEWIKRMAHRGRIKTARWHRLQIQYQWHVPPTPEYFDHFCDQHYNWRAFQNPLWLERGIFNLLAMKQNAKVLDICCGDGFNAFHFYSQRAMEVSCVDFDSECIDHAKKYNHADNISHRICDIRSGLPDEIYDNVIWDGAIEHFTEQEIAAIVPNIKKRLTPSGVLSGYTIVELPTGEKSLVHHEREFKSKEDLKSFFTSHFKNVKVFETIYPVRHNLYFFASDGVLPFDETWEGVTKA